MAKHTYRVVGANVRRPPAAGEEYERTPADVDRMLRKVLADNDVDIALLLEVARYHAVLRALPGYTALIFDDPGHGDNAILIRNGIPFTDARDIEHGGLAWWFTSRGSKSWGRAHVTVTVPGLWLLALHTPPSVSWINSLPAGPALRIRVFLAMMATLRAALEQQIAEHPELGKLVFGDWNEPSTAEGEDSPRDVAEDLGLKIFAGANIDWAMGRNVRVKTRVIAKGQEGNTSDHPLLVMDVTVQVPVTTPGPATPGTLPAPKPTAPTPAPKPTPAPAPPKEPVVAKPYLITHPPKRRQFRARTRKPTGLLVIHTAESAPDVVGPDTGTDSVARFIAGRADPGSYHVLADSDSRLQLVPYDQAAYGDGTGSNEFAIHLSVATQAAKWPQLPKAWRDGAVRQLAKAAAEAARWVKIEHGIVVPAARVTRAQSDQGRPGLISHGERDPGRRTDPGAGFPWAAFLQAFREEMDRAKPAPPTPVLNHVEKAHVHLVDVDARLAAAVRELTTADAGRTAAKAQLKPLRELRTAVAADKKEIPES